MSQMQNAVDEVNRRVDAMGQGRGWAITCVATEWYLDRKELAKACGSRGGAVRHAQAVKARMRNKVPHRMIEHYQNR